VSEQLASARAKVTRSAEHYATLAHACRDFTASQPHEVTVDFDAELGCYVAHFHVRRHPPHDLSLILGDLVHNARSALDHAAWQVACLRNAEEDLLKPKTRGLISFPITRHANEFARHPLLRFIPQEAQAVFERHQPYHGTQPHRHWLALLNRMWNADKHRLVHPSFALSEVGKTGFAPAAVVLKDMEGGFEIESLLDAEEGIEDGAKIAHVRFKAGARPRTQRVRVQTQPRAHIVFGVGEDSCGIGTIGTFCGTASLVLDHVGELFD
jgi:hypothetical protein